MRVEGRKTVERPLRLAVAGGGTGGHVFPGLAVVNALTDMTKTEVLWIGTGREVEERALAGTGIDYRILKVLPIKGTDLPALMKSMAHLPISVIRAVRLLGRFRPDVLLGVGGYVSGPVMLAARILRIPCAIHEQNLLPGLANRLAGKFAHRIFISFDESATYFPGRKVICTGNPVRQSLLEAAAEAKEPGTEGSFQVLVIGGSQGATSLNRLASSAIKALWHSGHEVAVWHQTGAKDHASVQAFYEEAGVPARVSAFIDDMGSAYGKADLVVCRAGATTIAELTVMGRPAIFIPYPYSAEGHQDLNAKLMEEMGAGIFLREAETGAVKLSSHIETLMEDREKLAKMANKARSLGKPDAAMQIASNLIQLAGFETKSKTKGD